MNALCLVDMDMLITEYLKVTIQTKYEGTFDILFGLTYRSHNNYYIFESMQETVQAKIKSSSLVELL